MNPQIVDRIEKYINVNAESFIKKQPQNSEEFNMKLNHTLRVKRAIEKICSSLECSEKMKWTAQAAALLHDLGRFEQFAQYNTFSDSKSVDHAELGIKIIQESGLLENSSKESAEKIIYAVKNHNKFQIESNHDKDSVFLAEMLRDADKIDILKVVTQYYTNSNSEKIAEMLNLPDTDYISDSICESILKGNIPEISNVKNCSDLKLMQMSWIYDINFSASLKIIRDCRYMESVCSSLPQTEEVKKIYNVLNNYVTNKLGSFTGNRKKGKE